MVGTAVVVGPKVGVVRAAVAVLVVVTVGSVETAGMARAWGSFRCTGPDNMHRNCT